MICPKCGASMVPDASLRFYATADYTIDLNDTRVECAAWRCLCGQYLDRIILANRAKQRDESRLIAQAETIALWAMVHPQPVCSGRARKGQ